MPERTIQSDVRPKVMHRECQRGVAIDERRPVEQWALALRRGHFMVTSLHSRGGHHCGAMHSCQSGSGGHGTEVPAQQINPSVISHSQTAPAP